MQRLVEGRNLASSTLTDCLERWLESSANKEGKGRPVDIIVRASGPSGPAKIHLDDLL
jgi:hypothetical protein